MLRPPSSDSAVIRGLACLAVATTLAALPAQVRAWPDFRGPAPHGVQRGVHPPLDWDDAAGVRWRTALPGPGSSNPVVLGDRIVLTCWTGYGASGDDPGEPTSLRHHVVCVDRVEGTIRWDCVIPSGRTESARQVQLREHGFASPSVVCDGERLFAYFGKTGLVALDLDGTILWRAALGSFDSKDTVEERPADRADLPTLRWGAAATPLIHGDLVIVNASEESDSVRALHRETGELVWKVESVKLEGSAVSPVLAGEGDDAVVLICPGGETWALDPATGAMRWSVATGTRGGLSPIPVCAAGLAVSFGGGPQSFGIRLAPGEDEDRIAWKSLNADIPSPILHDGRILMVQTTGTAACIEADDGEVVFRGRLPGRTGTVYAAPIVAGDRLYVVSRENGVFVYTADGSFELLAHNVLESDDSRFQATPAFVDDLLYLRSDRYLYAIGHGS